MQGSFLPVQKCFSAASLCRGLKHRHPNLQLQWLKKPRECLCKNADEAQSNTEVEETPSNYSSASSRQESPQRNPERLRLEKVERLGEDVWAGVAAVDRGENDSSTTLRKTALLVAGDFAALLLFAAIGRRGHGESLDFVAVLKTAAPFLIGWFGAADLQKAFGEAAQGGKIVPAAKTAAKVWATGIPVGIGVRSAQRGHLPDISFVIVTSVATFIFLVGWRTALAAITPEEPKDVSGKVERRRDRQGNPLEFFQLLSSLTKRW